MFNIFLKFCIDNSPSIALIVSISIPHGITIMFKIDHISCQRKTGVTEEFSRSVYIALVPICLL